MISNKKRLDFRVKFIFSSNKKKTNIVMYAVFSLNLPHQYFFFGDKIAKFTRKLYFYRVKGKINHQHRYFTIKTVPHSFEFSVIKQKNPIK